jgi:hypothetical protein
LRCVRFDHFERQGIGALREFERDGGHGRNGAVLDRESELIAVAAQVEVGVAPGMELGGTAQGAGRSTSEIGPLAMWPSGR